MGKNGGSSWLNAVKKVFRSPTKDNTKRSGRRRDEHEQEEEDKERGKRRWIFRKSAPHETTTIQHNEAKNILCIPTTNITYAPVVEANDEEINQRCAIATAQASVDGIRLTTRSRPSIFVRDNYAAISIQTAFRGYLARKALGALKGVVKLQALVRGQNVRKRANMTLRCMQALIRVQSQVIRDHCNKQRLSYDQGSMDSASSATTHPNKMLWESYLANRKTISRDGSNISTDEWDTHPINTMEEINANANANAMPQIRKETFLEHQDTLAHAFYHQMWKSGKDQFLANQEQEAKPIWYDQAPATLKQRNSFDHREPIKTVEMDTAQTYTYSASNLPRLQNTYHHFQQEPHSHSISSPLHRAKKNLSIDSPSKPSVMKEKPLKVHSASPHFSRQDRDLILTTAAHTPNLGSSYYHRLMDVSCGNAGGAPIPNYMAATASAKARCRSQSVPRHRPMTPEREKTVLSKKRLSFPVPDPDNSISTSDVESLQDHNLRRLSCNDGSRFRIEQRSSFCKDSLSDDDRTYTPATSDVRRCYDDLI